MSQCAWKPASVALVVLGGVLVPVTSMAQSPSLLKLYDFEYSTLNGSSPYTDLLAASDGWFYGADYYTNGYASTNPEFRIDSYGNLSQVTSFTTGFCSNICVSYGAVPGTLIQGSDSNFYGVTQESIPAGSQNSWGAIFKQTPGGQVTYLHYFSGSDGAYPKGALVQGGTNGNGAYFGTTSGGDLGQGGNVYRITSSGDYSVVHTFSALDGSGHNADGSAPMAGLVVGTDLNFYGATSKGGANGYGTVFKLTPQGVFTTLHSFSLPADGGNPMGPLALAADGNLYGTAMNGGANGDGSIFRIGLDGTFKRIHSFAYTDGLNPASRLVEVDSGTSQVLYGTTQTGGANGSGTIYSITTDAKFKSLYSFSASNGSVNQDGARPNGLTVGQDNDLYGTAYSGGVNAVGTAFEWIIQAPVATLKVKPQKIALGASATLTWSSTSTTSCSASGSWSGSVPRAGSQTLIPSSRGSYVYTLTCVGPKGSSVKTATLQVN